jgi:hypothetical protein
LTTVTNQANSVIDVGMLTESRESDQLFEITAAAQLKFPPRASLLRNPFSSMCPMLCLMLYFSLHSPDCHSLLLKCWLMNRCQQFYSPSTVLCSYLSPSLLSFFQHVSDVVSDAVSDGVCLYHLNTHRPKSISRESASTLTDHSSFPTKTQQWAPTILILHTYTHTLTHTDSH